MGNRRLHVFLDPISTRRSRLVIQCHTDLIKTGVSPVPKLPLARFTLAFLAVKVA